MFEVTNCDFKKSRPKICFVGTESGDAITYQEKFYSAYRSLPCEPSHLSLFKPHTRDIEGFIREQDIVHVGGGNTRNRLTLWKEWKLDQYLRSASENGTILSGMSAGMLCWFEEFTADSYGSGYVAMKGLGWLKGSAVPHFDGESERLPSYLGMIERGEIGDGIALDDGVGALFLDEEMKECVSSRPAARVRPYFLEIREDAPFIIHRVNAASPHFSALRLSSEKNLPFEASHFLLTD